MSATTPSQSDLLPPIASAFAQVPEGVNPFEYFAQQLSWAVFPGIAAWSKPVFIVFAVLSFLNLIATGFALWIKWRREGHLSLCRLVDHRSGSRFICVNSTNVFLAFHALSSGVFTVFPILHVFQYKKAGLTHMDLSWAILMWLAPYLGMLMACFGALYGIFVMPISYTKRLSSGELVPASHRVSRLPCWFLNGLVIGVPVLLTGSVMAPGIRLIVSAEKVEGMAVDMAAMLQDVAPAYSLGVPPSLEWQENILAKLQMLEKYGADCANRWRPLYGVWTGWIALAVLMSTISAISVHKVTKQRISAALHNFDDDVTSDNNLRTEHKRKSSFSTLVNTSSHSQIFDAERRMRQNAAVAKARWDHYNLTAHFASAAILLLIAEAVFIVDVVYGYTVHLRINLLAVTLLIPIIAYVSQGSIAVLLVIVRSIQGKTPESSPKMTMVAGSPSMAPGIFRTVSNSNARRFTKTQGMVVVHEETASQMEGKGIPISIMRTTETAYDNADNFLDTTHTPATKRSFEDTESTSSATPDGKDSPLPLKSEYEFDFGRAL